MGRTYLAPFIISPYEIHIRVHVYAQLAAEEIQTRVKNNKHFSDFRFFCRLVQLLPANSSPVINSNQFRPLLQVRPNYKEKQQQLLLRSQCTIRRS